MDRKIINTKTLIILIAFLIAFSFTYFSTPTPLLAYNCSCSGNRLVCYHTCELYATTTLPCSNYCNSVGYPYCASYDGIFALCCDNISSTSCTCGCSGGSCNASCTAGWGSCSGGDTNSTDSYACGSRTHTTDCCKTSSDNCWCDCIDCTPPTPVCPSGTSTGNTIPTDPLYPKTSDFHSTETESCDRTNGVSTNNCSPKRNSTSINCYCDACTPPLCSTLGYFESAQYQSGVYQGKVADSSTASCRRGGSSTPNRTTLCDLTYRSCYCSTCLKSCPSPLTNTGNANLILNDFRECTNDCGVKPLESEDDCYEPSSIQPTTKLSIVVNDPAPTANGYDFVSHTHTGSSSTNPRIGYLNDPLLPIKMKATYTDNDGASDIEGMFVWFRESHYTGVPNTPVNLSTTASPQSSARDSWGFMLRRNGTDWIPYVPSYAEATSYWTVATLSTTAYYKVFDIAAPDNQQMVRVSVISLPYVSAGNNNELNMEFSLQFSSSAGTRYGGKVGDGDYDILLLGLDKFSFTPYDNYPEINYGGYWQENFLRHGYTDLSYYWPDANTLRYKPSQNQTYARNWTDSGKNWVIDSVSPTITVNKEIQGNKIIVEWEATNQGDGKNLYAIVGDVYSSTTDVNRKEIDIDVVGTPSHTISLRNGNGVFTPESASGSGDSAGKLNENENWSFQVKPANLNSPTNSGTISIDVGQNTQGTLTIYLHVFDYAGNVNNTSVHENLSDRFLTGGGLLYSSGNPSFAELTLVDDSLWQGTLPPYPSSASDGMLRKYGGLTSEMLANRNNALLNAPATKSYSLSYSLGGYGNKVISETKSLYKDLKEKYEYQINNLGDALQEIQINTSSLANLSTCNKAYCVFLSSGDLTVNNGLSCDKKAVIFVDGDLSINPPIHSQSTTTLSNQNGCIFVVSGNVAINAGPHESPNVFEYAKVNAFIVADGVITVGVDNVLPPNIVDGVYINGGLISKGSSTSIVVNRYLRLEERLVYPVVAIDLHPKYGYLVEQFFAKAVVVQFAEAGIKP